MDIGQPYYLSHVPYNMFHNPFSSPSTVANPPSLPSDVDPSVSTSSFCPAARSHIYTRLIAPNYRLPKNVFKI